MEKFKENVISIYDNLYGYIKFEKEIYENIINNPYFLRLHSIRQMGLTSYVFPDALHTRFSHSIGVYNIVKKIINSQEKIILVYITLMKKISSILK
ncbi:hypothetical protein [Caldicellulosiruptor naganoensis]|uniref:HD domain-containing protein n=1 Tax=Caldicellulosiruptor naganoensis TaxID=29324 RepID=A0ABY7BEZ0_9FIRM|nr:hypothetical protein [Caldicellulosiruptor naganoensis]WAM31025.1 hypothetical protein OTJ99_001829 [Caldicellulosiruptor naganoensis]